MDEETKRGFAGMEKERHLEVAKAGGAAVPAEKRSFYTDREFAARAGKKGGCSVPAHKRSFYTNRELAAAAGSKGGTATHAKKVAAAE